MKRAPILVACLVAAVALLPAPADALSITQTFCTAGPGGPDDASCVEGLGATIEINDLDETERQYEVILTFDTSNGFDTAQNSAILSVQFAIDGYSSSDYESLPTLTAVPDGTVVGDWTVHFFSIPQCSQDTGGQNVCAIDVGGPGTDTGDVDVWRFVIDLDNSVDPISEDVALNLRAAGSQNVLLSPNFVPTDDTGGGEEGGATEVGGEVPEPASLLLLGTGLAVAGARARRRRANRQ